MQSLSNIVFLFEIMWGFHYKTSLYILFILYILKT